MKPLLIKYFLICGISFLVGASGFASALGLNYRYPKCAPGQSVLLKEAGTYQCWSLTECTSLTQDTACIVSKEQASMIGTCQPGTRAIHTQKSYSSCLAPVQPIYDECALDNAQAPCLLSSLALLKDHGPLNPGAAPDLTIIDTIASWSQSEIKKTKNESIVFITVSQREKWSRKYAGSQFVMTDHLSNISLTAFTSPERYLYQNFKGEKVIPIAIKAGFTYIGQKWLIGLRDEYLALRFGRALATKPEDLEKQKDIFLRELIDKLQISGLLDDQTAASSVAAISLGCASYKSASLSIFKPEFLELRDSDFALGHKAANDEDQKRAAYISSWYQAVGATPYVKPAPLDTKSIFDDSLRQFVKTHLLTCQPAPGLNELPQLRGKAPHFLNEVAQRFIHEAPQDFHLFHWAESARVYGTDLNNLMTPDATNPYLKNYLILHWKKFFFQDYQGDMAGDGLYLAPTPSTTAHSGYGTTVIDLTIPKGTRYLSYTMNRAQQLSQQSIAELSALGCRLEGSTFFEDLFASYNRECSNVRRALVLELSIAMSLYDYTDTQDNVASCENASVPAWAFVVYDPELLKPARVTTFNADHDLDASTLNAEQKFIAEYLSQVRYIKNVKNLSVAPKAFSKWVNTSLLGCGMGSSGWQKNWR